MSSWQSTITLLEEQLCDPVIFSDHEKALALQTELDQAKEVHDELEMDWLTLSEQLEQ